MRYIPETSGEVTKHKSNIYAACGHHQPFFFHGGGRFTVKQYVIPDSSMVLSSVGVWQFVTWARPIYSVNPWKQFGICSILVTETFMLVSEKNILGF